MYLLESRLSSAALNELKQPENPCDPCESGRWCADVRQQEPAGLYCVSLVLRFLWPLLALLPVRQIYDEYLGDESHPADLASRSDCFLWLSPARVCHDLKGSV